MIKLSDLVSLLPFRPLLRVLCDALLSRRPKVCFTHFPTEDGRLSGTWHSSAAATRRIRADDYGMHATVGPILRVETLATNYQPARQHGSVAVQSSALRNRLPDNLYPTSGTVVLPTELLNRDLYWTLDNARVSQFWLGDHDRVVISPTQVPVAWPWALLWTVRQVANTDQSIAEARLGALTAGNRIKREHFRHDACQAPDAPADPPFFIKRQGQLGNSDGFGHLRAEMAIQRNKIL
ncbi:hypothetical protein DHEL01_v208740 [Diaporthe helianthi]|uniref:Uncharacterized protein n=1 Tax=Diaporthe helianthi TaxID=158607 RepID=A0A2P5HRH5_DIAHE|nr:hypothetical protein DHEL01_v208740 [Diaporthe helianthi]